MKGKHTLSEGYRRHKPENPAAVPGNLKGLGEAVYVENILLRLSLPVKVEHGISRG